MFRHLNLLAAVVACLGISASSNAAFIAISQPAGAAPTQTGGPYVVGEQFTVNSAISVSDIGIFASTGAATPVITATTPVYVGIYKADTSTAGINFTQVTSVNTTQYGSTAMVVLNTFTPVTLQPGNYIVVAENVGDLPAQPTANSLGNSADNPVLNTGGGLITFGNFYYDTYAGTPQFPTMADSHEYTAGTFVFTAVPEPTSLSVLGLGGLGLIARRRRA